MATDMVRKHFILPRQLAEDFERLVGKRKQSAELTEMIANRLEQERKGDFFRDNAGFAKEEGGTERLAAEDVGEWVRKLRSEGWENPRVKELRGRL